MARQFRDKDWYWEAWNHLVWLQISWLHLGTEDVPDKELLLGGQLLVEEPQLLSVDLRPPLVSSSYPPGGVEVEHTLRTILTMCFVLCQIPTHLGHESTIRHLVPKVSFWVSQGWSPCSCLTTVFEHILLDISFDAYDKRTHAKGKFTRNFQPLSVGGVQLALEQWGKAEGSSNPLDGFLSVAASQCSKPQLEGRITVLNHQVRLHIGVRESWMTFMFTGFVLNQNVWN